MEMLGANLMVLFQVSWTGASYTLFLGMVACIPVEPIKTFMLEIY
jgi:hypothetical protein